MMSYAELFDVMSDLSLSALEAKHFGKKRSQQAKTERAQDSVTTDVVQDASVEMLINEGVLATSKVNTPDNPRYISKALKHQVWQRDNGACTNCGSQKNLNYDHLCPVALGGEATLENLRLLCFNCNQRASAKIFGVFQHVDRSAMCQ